MDGCVGPHRLRVRAPTASAMCRGPVSAVRSSVALFISAASSRRLVSPAMDRVGRFMAACACSM